MKELKLRAQYAFLSLLMAAFAAYSERDYILCILWQPLAQLRGDAAGLLESPIFFLQITEALEAQLKLSLLAGAFVSLPFAWLQLWLFLAPGLYDHEQKLLGRLLGSSFFSLSLGLLFTKDYLIPRAWSFFLSFGQLQAPGEGLLGDLSYLPSLIPYLNLSLEIFTAILISSQLPLLLFLLLHWQWVDENFLVQQRPVLIVFFLLWAALLSPPDLLSQILIFLPLFALYEFIVLFLFCRRALLLTALSHSKSLCL